MALGTAKKSASLTERKASSARPRSSRSVGTLATKNQRGAMVAPPSREEIRQMADALGRLADEGRLRILFLLEESPRNVAALVAALGQDRHSLSHHLRILRVSGLILSTRNGRRVDYSLTKQGWEGIKAARVLKV